MNAIYYRTQSPRLLRSPKYQQKNLSENTEIKSLPSIRDFQFIKPITEGAFG